MPSEGAATAVEDPAAGVVADRGAGEEAVDSVVAEVEVPSAEVAVAVRSGAGEAVDSAAAVAAEHSVVVADHSVVVVLAVVLFEGVVAASGAAVMAEVSVEDLAAAVMVVTGDTAAMVDMAVGTGAATGAASTASATRPGIGQGTPMIPTITEIPTFMGIPITIPVTTDTILMPTTDMAHTHHMLRMPYLRLSMAI